MGIIKTTVFFSMILISGTSFATTSSLDNSDPVDDTVNGDGCIFLVCKPSTAPIKEGNE